MERQGCGHYCGDLACQKSAVAALLFTDVPFIIGLQSLDINQLVRLVCRFIPFQIIKVKLSQLANVKARCRLTAYSGAWAWSAWACP